MASEGFQIYRVIRATAPQAPKIWKADAAATQCASREKTAPNGRNRRADRRESGLSRVPPGAAAETTEASEPKGARARGGSATSATRTGNDARLTARDGRTRDTSACSATQVIIRLHQTDDHRAGGSQLRDRKPFVPLHAHWAQTGRTPCEQTAAAEASQQRGRSMAATRQTSRDRPAAHIPQPVRARTGRAGRSGTRRARGYGGGGAPASGRTLGASG